MYRIRTQILNGEGGPWLSTMYFNEAGGTALQAATAVGTFWQAVDNFMPSGLTWDVENDVTTVAAVNGSPTSVVSVAGPTGNGALAAEIMPTQTQLLVRWRTGQYPQGREIRGRTFIPGLTETDSVAGNPSAAMRVAVDAAAAALISDVNSILVVWHRPTGEPPTGGQEYTVVSGNCWNRFAGLKSRRD